MGDMGDFYNAWRDHKRAVRAHWHECPDCAADFGTASKVPPGGKCRHHDWRAPGAPGDDRKAVAREATRCAPEPSPEQAARLLKARTCAVCNRTFSTPKGRKDHQRMAHGSRPHKEAADV